MKKLLKKTMLLILVSVLFIGTFAISADAVMKRTVKFQPWTDEVNIANKMATKVKIGTTKLTYKKGHGYLKFKAPKTKTYRFTFSDTKVSGEGWISIYFMKKSTLYEDSKILEQATVSTKGGKAYYLQLLSKGLNEKKENRARSIVKEKYLHTRTAKIKLKKGETVYIVFQSSAYRRKHTQKLVIK